MGAIVRDSKGEMILAASIKEQVLQDPKIVECLAILRGLQLCFHLGISCLSIESDCQLIVNQLQSSDCSSYFLGNILLDIKSPFNRCNIQFIYRNINQAAHRLARFARNIEHIVLWYETPPEFLS